MPYTAKGNGWTAHWESRGARDLRKSRPTRKAIAQMHRVAHDTRRSGGDL